MNTVLLTSVCFDMENRRLSLQALTNDNAHYNALFPNDNDRTGLCSSILIMNVSIVFDTSLGPCDYSSSWVSSSLEIGMVGHAIQKWLLQENQKISVIVNLWHMNLNSRKKRPLFH